MMEHEREDWQALSSQPQAKGLVVMNPSAGAGNPEELRAQIRAVLDETMCDLYEVEEAETLCKSLHTAVQNQGYSWLAAAGGDGTVSLVGDCATALGMPLAIIPAGTGNAFAGALGIPDDVEQAASLLLGGATTRRIDALRIGGKHYFLQVGVGLEALAMKETPADAKSKLGALAYVWTAAREAAGWQDRRFKLTLDDKVYHVQASELVLANTAGVGVLNMKWGEAIAPDDGVIDVVAILAQSSGDYLPILTALAQGTQQDSKYITSYQARRTIRVETDRPLPTHADGEVLEDQWPLEAQIVPGALSVLVPRSR